MATNILRNFVFSAFLVSAIFTYYVSGKYNKRNLLLLFTCMCIVYVPVPLCVGSPIIIYAMCAHETSFRHIGLHRMYKSGPKTEAFVYISERGDRALRTPRLYRARRLATETRQNLRVVVFSV